MTRESLTDKKKMRERYGDRDTQRQRETHRERETETQKQTDRSSNNYDSSERKAGKERGYQMVGGGVNKSLELWLLIIRKRQRKENMRNK